MTTTDPIAATSTPGQALLELTLLNAEAKASQFEDIVVKLLERGVPPEIVTRLSGLWEKTQMIAGEAVAIGKIILDKIVAFLVANPSIAGGLAAGAAIAALVAGLPLIGPLVAPYATPMAIIGGGAMGANMQRGHHPDTLSAGVVDLATKFFALLVSILAAVRDYWGREDLAVHG